jgi:hypothetical protein
MVGSTAMADVPLESGKLYTCTLLSPSISGGYKSSVIARSLCAEASTHRLLEWTPHLNSWFNGQLKKYAGERILLHHHQAAIPYALNCA